MNEQIGKLYGRVATGWDSPPALSADRLIVFHEFAIGTLKKTQNGLRPRSF